MLNVLLRFFLELFVCKFVKYLNLIIIYFKINVFFVIRLDEFFKLP